MYMRMRIWWEVVSVGGKIIVEKLRNYFYGDCIKRDFYEDSTYRY